MIESIEIINKKYDGEWIFLVNCEVTEDGDFLGGEVVLHSKSREEVFRDISKYKDHFSMFSFRYAGRIPEGVSILL